MDPGGGEHRDCQCQTAVSLLSFLYTHFSCAAPAASPGRLWGASAAQHTEVKDAPGSSGWLGHFLGSLAGVHLAPAEPE